MPYRRLLITGTIIALMVVYFLVFIPPNLTGAKDPNMLAAFQIDEWLQYPHVMRMTTQADTLPETLGNLFVYQHYYYGFPFYVISAAAILPLRAAAQFASVEGSLSDTTAIMTVLRQLSPCLCSPRPAYWSIAGQGSNASAPRCWPWRFC